MLFFVYSDTTKGPLQINPDARHVPQRDNRLREALSFDFLRVRAYAVKASTFIYPIFALPPRSLRFADQPRRL